MYRVMRKNLLSWWLRQYRICLKHGRPRFDPWVRKIPWRRNWQLSPVFLPGESHGQRNLEATVHSVAKSWTGLKPLSAHTRGREEEGLFGEGEEAELYPEGPR